MANKRPENIRAALPVVTPKGGDGDADDDA